MRREHPLWRGFWLAILWSALVLLGGIDWLAAFRGSRQALMLAATTAIGAGLPGLIGWFRHRSRPVLPGPVRLVLCFLGGAAMAIACGMAGSARILPALLTGSTGAYAFSGAAAVSACVAARLLRGEVDA